MSYLREAGERLSESKPVFSIIVPVYNAGSFLAKCIESIIGQTFKNIEIILINDGSVDDSLSVCHKFKEFDERIIVTDQKNAGPSIAKNVGIEISRGEYILFVDADDYIETDMVICMHKELKKTGSDLIICGYRVNEMFHDCAVVREVSFDANVYDGKIDRQDFAVLYKKPMINQNWNKVYCTNIIQSNKIRFKNNLSLGEDLLFNLEYMKHCRKITVINDSLYNFNRSNTGSLTHVFREDFPIIQKALYNDVCDFVRSYYDFDNGIYIPEAGDVYLQTMISYIATVTRSNDITSQKRRQIIKTIVADEELHDISVNIKKDNIKKRFLFCLFRTRAVHLLIMLLKERN